MPCLQLLATVALGQPASAGFSRQETAYRNRLYTEGTSTMPIWQQCLAMATLLVFIAWIYVLAILMLAAPLSPLAATAALAAWSTLLLPCTPLLWRPALSSPVFALWRKYFNYSVVYEEKLDVSQHYLYADFPHGAFPLSQLLALTVRHKAGWDGENFYGLAADSAFRIPLWRHVYTWLGIVPASVANLKKHIKWGCVACTPGGIAEMYLAGGKHDHIYIKSRKGFVSVSVEEGIPIVPVYHFGNTALLSFGPKFCEPYGRRWRFSLGLLYGTFGLPLPRRVALMMVVGPPVAVEKVARTDPRFQEVVDETHGRYMATLQALHDKYRAVYGATCEGWADRQLVMH
eukprot:GHRQ01007123.1.p1 GENE.GHRQ01007123.1~~GHRQ01007123.1.p1  ORF type:complete len:345 (+),score=115.83 GHRQ01007123.1:1057-2091(+)